MMQTQFVLACRDADKVSSRTNDTLESVAQLELIQAPGLAFSIPKDLRSLPRLTGTAPAPSTNLSLLSIMRVCSELADLPGQQGSRVRV